MLLSIFGFEGGVWDLIESIPDHCRSIYFQRVGQSNNAKLLMLFIGHCDLYVMVNSVCFESSTLFNNYASWLKQFIQYDSANDILYYFRSL